MLIVIPFQDEFSHRMLNGTKVATSRVKAYGRPGDTFYAFRGALYYQEPLSRLRLKWLPCFFTWRKALKLPGIYRVLEKSHPMKIFRKLTVKGYRPKQLVYVHYFEKTKINLQLGLELDKVAVT